MLTRDILGMDGGFYTGSIIYFCINHVINQAKNFNLILSIIDLTFDRSILKPIIWNEI